MQDETLEEMRRDIKDIKKLLESVLGVQANSIQQLGVVDRPSGVKKLSISQNDEVMLEQENPDGSWGNSSIKHICGYLSGLERWDHTYRGKPTVYLSVTISADAPYSIRSNIENTFSRMLISIILGMTSDQLASILTLTVVAGSTVKTVRMPEITDSFGSKIMLSAIKDHDWDKNAISYVDQAAAKIKSIYSASHAIGMGRTLPAIAPSNTIDIPHYEPTEEELLQRQVIASAKRLWGNEEFKTKGVEYSAKHFDGRSLKDMPIADLQKYLQGLEALMQTQEVA